MIVFFDKKLIKKFVILPNQILFRSQNISKNRESFAPAFRKWKWKWVVPSSQFSPLMLGVVEFKGEHKNVDGLCEGEALPDKNISKFLCFEFRCDTLATIFLASVTSPTSPLLSKSEYAVCFRPILLRPKRHSEVSKKTRWEREKEKRTERKKKVGNKCRIEFKTES